MTNWMKTIIFLPLMGGAGESMSVCRSVSQSSPGFRSTHTSRPAITQFAISPSRASCIYSRLQSVHSGKESGPSRTPVNGTQASLPAWASLTPEALLQGAGALGPRGAPQRSGVGWRAQGPAWGLLSHLYRTASPTGLLAGLVSKECGDVQGCPGPW